MTEAEKEAREILNNTEWDGFMITIKNLIQKQDTEINKLNNVIDKLVEELRYEVGMGQDSIFCNDICNHYKENCKEEKCRKCIKEYFMKEDK